MSNNDGIKMSNNDGIKLSNLSVSRQGNTLSLTAEDRNNYGLSNWEIGWKLPFQEFFNKNCICT